MIIDTTIQHFNNSSLNVICSLNRLVPSWRRSCPYKRCFCKKWFKSFDVRRLVSFITLSVSHLYKAKCNARCPYQHICRWSQEEQLCNEYTIKLTLHSFQYHEIGAFLISNYLVLSVFISSPWTRKKPLLGSQARRVYFLSNWFFCDVYT